MSDSQPLDLSAVLDDMEEQRKTRVPQGLGHLTDLAEEMGSLEDEIAALQAQIDERQQRVNKIATEEIPEIMSELGGGITGIDMKDGRRLTLRAFYGATFPKEKPEEAIQFLLQEGKGDLIKTQVVTRFGMHEFNKAVELARKLQQDGFQVGADQSVAPPTLKKWVREMSEAGRFSEIPEIFNPKAFHRAVIK